MCIALPSTWTKNWTAEWRSRRSWFFRLQLAPTTGQLQEFYSWGARAAPQVHPPQNVYIKTAMKDSTLVLISEAAALALAVTVTDRLQLNHINFLSDSQQLVQFLNSSDHSNPPDWRIKPFTQIITQGRSTSIGVKVSRNMNHTADLLARQTLRACLVPPLKFSPYHIGCLTHAWSIKYRQKNN